MHTFSSDSRSSDFLDRIEEGDVSFAIRTQCSETNLAALVKIDEALTDGLEAVRKKVRWHLTQLDVTSAGHVTSGQTQLVQPAVINEAIEDVAREGGLHFRPTVHLVDSTVSAVFGLGLGLRTVAVQKGQGYVKHFGGVEGGWLAAGRRMLTLEPAAGTRISWEAATNARRLL